MIRIITENQALEENTAKLLYRIINELLYFDDEKRDLRLYILIILKAKVFKLAHNEMKHSKYIRTYKRLINGLYIFSISTKLYKFIRHYSHY